MGGVVASVVVLLPIVYIGIRATDQGWDRFVAVAWRRRTRELTTRSIELALVVTALSAIVGIGAAWLVARADLPLRAFWRVALAMPLAIPSYIAAWGWIGWSPSLAGFRGSVLVLTLISYPYVYLPVLGALRRADPALAEVARSAGRSPAQVFVGVTLRQIRIAAFGGCVLVALYTLSEFGAVSIMRYETLTKVIYTSYRASFDRTPAAVLGCVLVAITLVPLWLGVRSSAAGRIARVGSGVGHDAATVRLGLWRWPAVAGCTVVLAAALGVPLWNALRWTTQGTSSADLSDVFAAARTTLLLGVLGAAATVVVALPVAMLSARHPGGLANGVTTVAYAGHALPGIVVGLSLVFFGVRVATPLYQRMPMLIAAYVVVFLSLAIGALHTALAQVAPELDDVARSSGRGPLRAWLAVTLPLAAPGAGVAAALVCIAVMKELPATLLLRPIGTDTLATRLWAKTDAFSYAAAAPYAVALVVTASIPTALLTRFSMRQNKTGQDRRGQDRGRGHG